MSMQRKFQRKDTRNCLFEMLKLRLKRKDWVDVARIRHELNEMFRRDEGGYD